ncbi:hypothetical protein LL06_23640 [Hoeflea sp. BAL378]|uniref:hypothetical protein n=1 Tax=Hoeflea sp. BAL378 TaxID=1547437 RepID=UPI0005134D47|nr:hypothetical protein [Hoeflea sp. BAL378]KGF67205.1 hypothetical protein LL06_23640 [Hoeflea sp. BAL378]
MILRLLKSSLVAVAVSAGASTVPAAAQQPGFSAADLPVVMTAYVEAVIDMRAAYETCAPADKRPADWEQGADLLVESLKAAGLTTGVTSALGARLAAPVVPFAGDCAGEQALLFSGVPAGYGWADYHREVLDRNGIRIVEPGASDARLEAVRAVVAEALPRQRRMLVCLSLFEPQNFLAAFSDWNGLVAKAAQAFADAGLGPEAYGPILDGALSRAVFAPAPDRAAASADCMANQDWMNRFSTFAWYSFASDIEAALKDGKP